ncbi:MAG: hypothetical protein CL943_04080 [Candidatus Diapherotrites archaeon]|uniref:Polyamine aminopropyltransferase n=1 Tax=Candidatus Iainarchaeum sp. TaxID=3101447 RepID=A0A2D6M212_9ARCH|nr:hypothetical protein [Candidatus Diapherotrites archaeon]|tara:strand:- start:2367 stop:4526 length:2160 start_codon:yes stop_codon:yes gene_type:complete
MEFFEKHFSKVVLFAFFVSGAAGLMYEIIWFRYLQMIFGTTVYAASTMLTAFMAGLALGSWLVGRYADKRIKNPAVAFSYCQLLIGIYGIGLIFVFNMLPMVSIVLQGILGGQFFLYSLARFAAIFLLLIFPTTLMGATFPLIAKAYAKKMDELGKDIANVYSVNSMGAIIGSFAAGFLVIPLIGMQNSVLLTASLNLLSAGIVLLSQKTNWKKVAPAFIIFFLLLVFPPQFEPQNFLSLQRVPGLEQWEQQKVKQELLFFEDSIYGNVSVIHSQGGGRALLTEGKTDASTNMGDMRTQKMIAHIPILLHENPKEVLLIGLGAGFTLQSALTYEGVERVDVVEINPSMVKGADLYFSEFTDNALSNEKTNLILDDGRNYLLYTKEKYDIIASEPSNPHVSSVAFLFTKEYLEMAKAKLKDDGIMIQWFPAYEIAEVDYRIMAKTFTSVFPHYVLIQSNSNQADTMAVGSFKPIELSFSKIKEKLAQNPKSAKDLMEIGYNEDNVLLGFTLNEERMKEFGADAPVNTDDKTILEFSAPIARFSKSNAKNALLNFAVEKKLDKGEGLIEIPFIDLLIEDESSFYLNKVGAKIEKFDGLQAEGATFSRVFPLNQNNDLSGQHSIKNKAFLSWNGCGIEISGGRIEQKQSKETEENIFSNRVGVDVEPEWISIKGIDILTFEQDDVLFAQFYCEEQFKRVIVRANCSQHSLFDELLDGLQCLN